MKKVFQLLILTQILLSGSTAQGLKKITLQGNGNFGTFTFYLGESVVLELSQSGQIMRWGVDIYESAGRNDNFSDKLEPYTGKTGNFTELDDSSYRGKIKFIGRHYITYYASYESKFLQGKVKSIGNFVITYYESYEDEAYRGYVKSIGSHAITWHRSFDGEMLRGKLKSVASTQLRYYGPVDDKAFRGKIKSIGNSNYTYYSSLDRQGYGGSLKSGQSAIFESGIKYLVR